MDSSTAAAMRLAIEHTQAGRWQDAAEVCSTLLVREPAHADALNLMGLVSSRLGRPEKSLEFMQRAVRLEPENAWFLNNFGNALMGVGRVEEGVRAYQQAVALRPEYLEAHNNLAVTFLNLGRASAAEQSFRRVVQLKPDHVVAWMSLGNVLKDQGRAAEAESSYRSALAANPRDGAVLNNLGVLLGDLGRPVEAEQVLRDALMAIPERPETHANLAKVLATLGRLEEALQSCRHALSLRPDFSKAHSTLIFTLDLIESATVQEQQAERRRWYERHAQTLGAALKPHYNRPDPERRLRIGYVSGDFWQHSAYYVFAPVIRRHARADFEVICYSEGKREDESTQRLRGEVGLWRRTLGMADEALSEQIRADGIDILVDLSGHSAGSRLLVFARKPAPVQVTAWGHATGTGLKTMDYFLADPVTVPEAERRWFAEEVVDLPSALCYEPPSYLPEVTTLPALEAQGLTYGCVNRLEKVTERVIRLWGRILQSAPQARLLVKDKGFAETGLRHRFLRRLQDVGGIEPNRVMLHGPSAHPEHMKIFHQIDVGLDPFPQGGGVSTAEALWMGVPVVTLLGATPPSRSTASFLTVLGMQDWIGRSDDDYVRVAIDAGRDLPRLAKLRLELRSRAATSSAGDLPRYTRAVEQVYRSLWRRWCARQK